MLIEDKENKITGIYANGYIYLYEVIVPDGLIKDFNTDKRSVLLYHTEEKKKIKVRKQPSKKRIEEEIKKLLKERDNEIRKKK